MEEDDVGLQLPFGSLGGAVRSSERWRKRESKKEWWCDLLVHQSEVIREGKSAGFVGDKEDQFCWWPYSVCWGEERVGGATSVVVNSFAGEYEVAAVVWFMLSVDGENEEEEKSSISP
ncbi:hypothetical protein HAX54_050963 [Datura stramonium]|uniref:Uncharacterized protein n=1 Tax=Datura stramonium TaxID=4076 RepID=A0ABS8SXP7_DATST|nr:hypothetical protein [Datura stramonium]